MNEISLKFQQKNINSSVKIKGKPQMANEESTTIFAIRRMEKTLTLTLYTAKNLKMQ